MNSFLPRTPRLRPLLGLCDAALLGAAIWLAHMVRFAPVEREEKWRQMMAHPGLLVTALLAMWALAVAAELYEPFLMRRRSDAATRVTVVALVWGGALVLATYVVPSWRFGRGLLLLTTVTWAVAATAVRGLLALWYRRRPRPLALVVGEPEAVREVCRKLGGHPLAPWEPVDGSGLTAAAVAEKAHGRSVELVVLVGAESTAGGLAGDLAALLFAGVPVVVASEVWAWLDGRLPVSELSPATFLHQPGFAVVHWQLFNRMTRVTDVVLGGLLLILAAPIVALAGLAVLLFDGAPVFYLQTRVGQFGRHFRIVKLRTMRRDAEETGPSFAAACDPRVTRLGRVLRRLRVDELPQLLNVVKGDMSLVGPRPERPEFVADLAQSIPYYTFRLAVPPGLTGWAQVNTPYARSEDEHRRKLEYDLYFIRERSFGMYLLTLLRTASATLVGARR
ncbi:MAG TPA: exopolysaccharide biosynthesis polyprenyl glycosylphosphotransferase [Thermoanaerobaculaceae bacterium]|nr:exopolysaccharide biosynthesis polyprenyl glycosylphosphotransferase [Thermoanaerobaculaceae bacterium]